MAAVRAFIAIPLPEDVLESLARVQARLREGPGQSTREISAMGRVRPALS